MALRAEYYSEEGDRGDDGIDGTLVNNGHAPVLNINKAKGKQMFLVIMFQSLP